MVSQKVKVVNLAGFDVEPAGKLCATAVKFQSHIVFHKGEEHEANAKSVLSVLGSCIRVGDEIEISCDGEDEEEALHTLVALIASGFGE